MIIRMTVNDNDFTSVLERFCFWFDFFNKLYFGCDEDIPEDENKKTDWFFHQEAMREMLNPNKLHKLSSLEIDQVCNEIKNLWKKFVCSHPSSDYLVERFKVDIQYKMEDKWENGEVVYYFTTNQKFITQ